MSKWVLLRVWSSNEWYDGCDFALVELDLPFVTRLLERLEALKALREEDKDLYEASFWDYSLIWYNSLGKEDDPKLYDIQDFLDGSMPDEFLLLDEKPAIADSEVTPVECPRQVVGDTSIYWSTYPRKCEGTRLNTAAIPTVLLEELRAAMKEKVN